MERNVNASLRLTALAVLIYSFTAQAGLYTKRYNRFTKPQIGFCWWAGTSPATADLRQKIQIHLVANISKANKFEIDPEWPACESLSANEAQARVGIVIFDDPAFDDPAVKRDILEKYRFFEDYTEGRKKGEEGQPRALNVGATQIYNMFDLVLTSRFKNVVDGPTKKMAAGLSARGKENLILSMALHETLHIFGADHEHRHPKSTCKIDEDPKVAPDNVNSDIISAFDAHSIMSYCVNRTHNYEASASSMTAEDVAALAKAYEHFPTLKAAATAVAGPSLFAGQSGIVGLTHTFNLDYLVSLLREGELIASSERAKRRGEKPVPPEDVREILQYSRVYLSLLSAAQSGSSVNYAHYTGSVGDAADSNAIFLFSNEVLDRNDYHISRGWLYGHYGKSFDRDVKAESAEVIHFAAATEPSDKNSVDLAAYTVLLEDLRKSAGDLSVVFSEGHAEAWKNIVIRYRAGGLNEPVLKKVLAKLKSTNGKFDYVAQLNALLNPKFAEEEAGRFQKLMRSLGGDTVKNEVVFRAPVRLTTLQKIMVAPTRRQEILGKLKALGNPANVNSRWQGLTWEQIVISPATY